MKARGFSELVTVVGNMGAGNVLRDMIDSDDFFFVNQPDDSGIPSTIIDLCSKRLPAHFNLTPASIQVLCPMRRGEIGAQNLNILLQAALNASKEAPGRGGTEYRLGDKVMQIRNNNEKEVCNSDIGSVVSIDGESRSLSIPVSPALRKR